jgi:hypothetical protein
LQQGNAGVKNLQRTYGVAEDWRAKLMNLRDAASRHRCCDAASAHFDRPDDLLGHGERDPEQSEDE